MKIAIVHHWNHEKITDEIRRSTYFLNEWTATFIQDALKNYLKPVAMFSYGSEEGNNKIMEEIFHRTNHINESWTEKEKDNLMVGVDPERTRSTSVGDFMEIKEVSENGVVLKKEFFIVNNFGFITPPNLVIENAKKDVDKES